MTSMTTPTETTETTAAEAERKREERRAAREREVAEHTARWGPLVLSLTPKGRYMSDDKIAEKVNDAMPHDQRPRHGVVYDVLRHLARDGKLFRETMERGGDGYAVPTPKLREKRRAAEAKRKARDERAARLEAAEARAMEALTVALGPDSTADSDPTDDWKLYSYREGGAVLGHNVFVRLLVLAGMTNAAEAVRAWADLNADDQHERNTPSCPSDD